MFLTSIQIRAASSSDYKFSTEATYAIAGGLGGIGRCIARWLVQRGARNLILISRSGPAGRDDALSLLRDLDERGVKVRCPTCDISNFAALKDAIDACSADLPPIKGCFQASMVLRVCVPQSPLNT